MDDALTASCCIVREVTQTIHIADAVSSSSPLYVSCDTLCIPEYDYIKVKYNVIFQFATRYLSGLILNPTGILVYLFIR